MMSRALIGCAALIAAVVLACSREPLHAAQATSPATNSSTQPAKPRVEGFAQERVREKMGRAFVAMPRADGCVYFSWRLLAGDPKDIAFHVFRRAGNTSARLTEQPIRNTTDFLYAAPPAGDQEYSIAAVEEGRVIPLAETVTATAARKSKPYISIKLDGDHTFQKVAIADLDGDGRYDYVVKQPDGNVDPYKNYWKKSPATYKLEAYRSNGAFLWRYDLGWAIEQGIWYSPYVVYDLDGDGCAEVAVKTGRGDPRDADGRVTSGAEYLSILDGRTGKEKVKIDWPSREGFADYNYYCRNQLSIAYLDGKTPCLIVNRGTYNTIKLVAYQLHGGKLEQLWSWKDTDEGPAYRGQGAHCLRAADVDGDGRDEVVLGSAVIDDDGRGLWATRLGHPDHVYIGDLDPNRPGLEIYYGIESRSKANGMCMVDAATGRILWGIKEPTRHVHSQGLVADLDARFAGAECYSADTDAEKKFAFGLLHTADGKLIAKEDLGGMSPRAAYWDGDGQRELVLKGRLVKYGGAEVGARIEGTVVGVADILGDWREEIVTSVSGELRIYCTTIPASDRRPSLMTDAFYRLDIASASQGYYQIPTPRVMPGTGRR